MENKECRIKEDNQMTRNIKLYTDDCKGCYEYEEYYPHDCSIIEFKGNPKECPCRTCLIKVICITKCDEQKDLISIAIDDGWRVYPLDG
jgi:hypothetical protein